MQEWQSCESSYIVKQGITFLGKYVLRRAGIGCRVERIIAKEQQSLWFPAVGQVVSPVVTDFPKLLAQIGLERFVFLHRREPLLAYCVMGARG